jgi:phenylpropionate dioxygenase-like ring-hydroxylating dioxygenase large terminal subunit
MSSHEAGESDVPLRRPTAVQPPLEGADGRFSQSWFALCLSTDVAPGQLRGYDFLDGRVVVMRGEDGVAQVLSAYCPHLGADLSVGEVVGDTVRCAFHHWQYDRRGRCVKTAVGDPAPPSARLFRFPTCERYGVIFAFNGETPLFDLPGFDVPDDELLWITERFDGEFPVDPWVICCNTPDVQHIRVLHRIQFDSEDPGAAARWTDHSMVYRFAGRHAHGEPIDMEVGIYGTTVFYQSASYAGKWFGFVSPMGLPRPQRASGYLAICVRRDEPGAEELARDMMALERRVVAEDGPVLGSIHFRPGALTASDRTLARFLNYLTKYPRAHPARDFIR